VKGTPELKQPDTHDDKALLWNAFDAHRDPLVREQLINLYLPFARILAAKAYAKRTSAELEFLDYLQYASVGLVESVDRYDPNRGVKFETYSAPRITGAILNGIESLSEKQEQISVRRRIVSERVDSIKGTRLAAKDPDALFGYLAEVAIGLAVGFALENSGMYQADVPLYPDNTYERIELKQLQERVRSLVASLPPNENRVVTYHYLQQLGFEEIAAILGVTKGRISQIHKDAMHRLRKSLRNGDGIDLRC
jgi:RNA polymerase sigma factor for flagellar operon FliA